MKAGLERLANIATLLTCVVVCGLVVIRLTETVQQTTSSPPYKLGDKMDTLAGVDYAQSPQTLIMFVRSGCRFCTESMPLYQTIANSRHHRDGRFRILAVSSEAVPITQAYLAMHAVHSLDQIVSVSPGQTRFMATPTLVVVDHIGRVVYQAVGKLSSEKERSLLTTLRLG